MTGDLEAGIVEEIKKTGFPLELRVSDLLRSRGYYVAHSAYYVDRDEGKGREIDLRAVKSLRTRIQRQEIVFRHYLLVECKKSADKPWVVFTSPESPYDATVMDTHSRPVGFRLLPDPHELSAGEKLLEVFRRLDENHPLFGGTRRGRSYFEPFRGGGTGHTIFKALTSAAKATIAARDDHSELGDLGISFFYPLIVLEGRLFDAHLEDGEIELDEVDSAVVSFFYTSAEYHDESFIIAVVVEESLTEFCDSLDAMLDYWAGLVEGSPELFQIDQSRALSCSSVLYKCPVGHVVQTNDDGTLECSTCGDTWPSEEALARAGGFIAKTLSTSGP